MLIKFVLMKIGNCSVVKFVLMKIGIFYHKTLEDDKDGEITQNTGDTGDDKDGQCKGQDEAKLR